LQAQTPLQAQLGPQVQGWQRHCFEVDWVFMFVSFPSPTIRTIGI
jgi:hypothetical protein